MTRRGFTVLELLAVLAIFALLASLAVPRVGPVVSRAEATRVIGDYNAIRHAAFDVRETTGSWPAAAGDGEVPPGMTAALPTGFGFTHGGTTYRWRTWSLPDGLPGAPADTVVVAVEVTSSDAAMLVALRKLYRGPIAFGTNNRIILVVE